MSSIFYDDQLLNYTDAQIAHYIDILPCLPKHSNITLLSPKYLAKAFDEAEAKDAITAIEFASGLGIHVPRIKRSVLADNAVYCIMDRIPGATLTTEWLNLGWFTTIRLALQLPPRNIMLDPTGQLWVTDWDYAGFYPKFFEYAGMQNFIPTGWSRFALWR
ncbi:uncharacterized protein HRG_04467 [Hirsutella rhossiliensis]|uniref:Aminoglycoside phosphotransferase domain-containing protein n=1 Tax=Hirsutella rhossiliensis TaxID=111463 RepID=A0A9P8SJB4_9HYPO|nr:uncharacterized protein HRG_04467 [Hirsutella rhossiliensis]KAH0964039.1 hypothetical protein HRG_04467 [Hirsutella rhossiliensis]